MHSHTATYLLTLIACTLSLQAADVQEQTATAIVNEKGLVTVTFAQPMQIGHSERNNIKFKGTILNNSLTFKHFAQNCGKENFDQLDKEVKQEHIQNYLVDRFAGDAIKSLPAFISLMANAEKKELIDAQLAELSCAELANMLEQVNYFNIPTVYDALVQRLAQQITKESFLQQFKEVAKGYKRKHEKRQQKLAELIPDITELAPELQAAINNVIIDGQSDSIAMLSPFLKNTHIPESKKGKPSGIAAPKYCGPIWFGPDGLRTIFDNHLYLLNPHTGECISDKKCDAQTDHYIGDKGLDFLLRLVKIKVGPLINILGGYRYTASAREEIYEENSFESRYPIAINDNAEFCALRAKHLHKKIGIFNIHTGECLHKLKKSACTLTFSNKYNLLASGSKNGTVHIWNHKTGKLLRTLKAHKSSIWTFAFNDDDSLMACNYTDGTICIWQLPWQTIKKDVSYQPTINILSLLTDSPDADEIQKAISEDLQKKGKEELEES